MIYDDTHTFISQPPVYNQKSTRQVHRIPFKRGGEYQLGICNGELLRIIQQRTVDASFVRSFIMNKLIIGNGRLTDEIRQHPAVLHFCHTNNSRTFGNQISRQRTQHHRQIMQFRFVFLRCPLITAIRQKIMIVLTCIMNGIKQILKIIKSYTVQLTFCVLGCRHYNAETKRK